MRFGQPGLRISRPSPYIRFPLRFKLHVFLKRELGYTVCLFADCYFSLRLFLFRIRIVIFTTPLTIIAVPPIRNSGIPHRH